MATRTRKWKDRQCNGQNKKDKRTNKDLQNTAQNTNDWTIATPLQLRVNSGSQEELAVPAIIVALVVLLLKNTNIIQHGYGL
jgi:hypothetical protein